MTAGASKVKGELIDTRAWPAQAGGRRAAVEYIAWYNGTRPHSWLGCQSPAGYGKEAVVVQLPPDLAAVVERVCERWELTLSGEAPRGDQNTILAASRQGVPWVLEIAGPGHNAIDEAIALEAWNGNGAARLLEADRGHVALLLERLDPDRSLCTAGLATAAEIAGTLIHELAVPAPAGLPLLTDIASQKPGILRRRQSALVEPVPAAGYHIIDVSVHGCGVWGN